MAMGNNDRPACIIEVAHHGYSSGGRRCYWRTSGRRDINAKVRLAGLAIQNALRPINACDLACQGPVETGLQKG